MWGLFECYVDLVDGNGLLVGGVIAYVGFCYFVGQDILGLGFGFGGNVGVP